MPGVEKASFDHDRLREIADILRRAFVLPEADTPAVSGDFLISDILLALDSTELREILSEIKALQQDQLRRLERLLSRHSDNDS